MKSIFCASESKEEEEDLLCLFFLSKNHSMISKMSRIRCTYLQIVCGILNPDLHNNQNSTGEKVKSSNGDATDFDQ
jgi:hypothetical protein